MFKKKQNITQTMHINNVFAKNSKMQNIPFYWNRGLFVLMMFRKITLKNIALHWASILALLMKLKMACWEILSKFHSQLFITYCGENWSCINNRENFVISGVDSSFMATLKDPFLFSSFLPPAPAEV